MSEIMYEDAHLRITRQADVFYLETLQAGMGFDVFSQLLAEHFPALKVTSFVAVRNTLGKSPAGPVEFARQGEIISIHESADGVRAWVNFHMTSEELEVKYREVLLKSLRQLLTEQGITEGLRWEALQGVIVPQTDILIAEGKAPVNGQDAIVHAYMLPPPKPRTVQNGNVNYFELEIIHQVQRGDWLGEREDATDGTPGITVHGTPIPPIPGKTLPLSYDKTSVEEVKEGEKTVLRARKSGAIFFEGDRVGVYNFLEVKSDVDFTTGSIDFDGYVSVRGVVMDEFSIDADRDIEILGEYGVGAAEHITSRNGNIYIKGGIAGKGKAVIHCKKNLYVKYLSDVTVECEGTVYVGFYCYNSNIRARSVIVDAAKGRITGGTLEVAVQVASAEFGNPSGSRTILRVTGFNREKAKADLEQAVRRMESLKQELAQTKLVIQEGAGGATPEKKKRAEVAKERFDVIRDEMKQLEQLGRMLAEDLRTPGEGTVMVKSILYPNVRVEICGFGFDVSDPTKTGWTCRNGELVSLI